MSSKNYKKIVTVIGYRVSFFVFYFCYLSSLPLFCFFPSHNFCEIKAILGLCGGVACFKFFVDNIIDNRIDKRIYKMISFSTFTHLKSDAIAQMLQNNSKIELSIKPKERDVLELTIMSRDRARELENIEKEILAKQKAALWEKENAEAINEQNERVARRGVFGDSVRRF